MPDGGLFFPRAEYAGRAARLQNAMADAGLDALLLTEAADITYLTGFLTQFWESPARPWYVILPLSGDPVAVIPSIGAELMGRSAVGTVHTWPSPEPPRDGLDLLAATIADLVPQGGTLGTPMGPETALRMPASAFAALSSAIAPRRVVDATAVTQRVREVKTQVEIDQIATACAIAGAAFAGMPDRLRAGQTVADAFRAFQVALLEAGADWVRYVAGGAGPDGYGDVISPAGPAPLRAGDVLMLDTGAVAGGYFCDFDRNYAIGPPSPAAQRAHDALFAATEAGLAAAGPGITAEDLHRVMADHLTAAGAQPLNGRFGHGLGLVLTEWPSLQPGDRTALRPGMVLTLEPGVTIRPGCIQVHEEVIAITETGARLLSPRAPSQMPVIAA